MLDKEQIQEEESLLELFRSVDETNIEIAFQIYEGLTSDGTKLRKVAKFLSIFGKGYSKSNVSKILTYNKNIKDALCFIEEIENETYDRLYDEFCYNFEYYPLQNHIKQTYQFSFPAEDFDSKIENLFIQEIKKVLSKDESYFLHTTDFNSGFFNPVLIFKFSKHKPCKKYK